MGTNAGAFSQGGIWGCAVLIIALTGTCPDGFERLIRQLDELAGRDSGMCLYSWAIRRMSLVGAGSKGSSKKSSYANVEESELVITHGGFGSIRDALSMGKSVVAVPRRHEFREHQDDHQKELVDELEKIGLVISVFDVAALDLSIERARTFTPGILPKSKIPQIINKFLSDMA